jgi:hypothetical protein
MMKYNYISKSKITFQSQRIQRPKLYPKDKKHRNHTSKMKKTQDQK